MSSEEVLPRDLYALGKHEASHPKTVLAVLERLEDTRSDDAARDVIVSLYWRLRVAENTAQLFADELMAKQEEQQTDKDARVIWRTEYKDWCGYWSEYDTHGDEQRARDEYERISHDEKRLIRVEEQIVACDEDLG